MTIEHVQEEGELIEIDFKLDYFGRVQLKWFSLFLFFNALIGFILFEWGWYMSHIARNHPKELNDIFPNYRRSDARNWSRLQFYPGALTVLIPRIVILMSGACSLVFFINVTMIGQDMNRPIGPIRKGILLFWYKLHIHFMCIFGIFCLMTSKYITNEEVGWYEEYLGP